MTDTPVPDPLAGDPRTQRERMLAGELYRSDDPEIDRAFQRALALSEAYNQAMFAADPAARGLLEELLGSVGADVVVRPPLRVDYGTQISIGARTFINFGLVALDVARIDIGADCQIGPGVQLLTPTHPLNAALRRAKWEAAEPISIGDNVWIGGGAIICPGVRIGDDVVIGAGSVVTKDIPARSLAVGNPARVVRELD